MHLQTHNSHAALKIIPNDQWQKWRKDRTDAGDTVAVITGTFALLHPGNLAAIREAARRASHVCIVIHPDNPITPEYHADAKSVLRTTVPHAAMSSLAVRLEMAASLRAVSMVTTCLPTDADKAFATLRPFTLVDCSASKAFDAISTMARKWADQLVDLTPLTGCFTADIQKAIQDGRTPISIPDAAIAPLPDGQDLARLLDAGASGRPLVTVNGCFDVLHLGHMRLLTQARNYGIRLLVLVNDDNSVKTYKGIKRPIFPIRFRLHVLNALDAVTMAFPFTGDNPLPLLSTIRPDIHVKGGSFEETRVREERNLVKTWGGQLKIIPLVEGFSTSAVVNQLATKPTTGSA